MIKRFIKNGIVIVQNGINNILSADNEVNTKNDGGAVLSAESVSCVVYACENPAATYGVIIFTKNTKIKTDQKSIVSLWDVATLY